MRVGEAERIPEWAARERMADLAWIGENTHVLLPVAKLAFEEHGRGVLVVDTNTIVKEGEYAGHPIFYLPAQQVEQNSWPSATKMVREYVPSWEFVALLLKKSGESAYRIGVPSEKK